MNYVVSDIHGQYDAFKRLLKKIDFKEEDHLYVLGDTIDRGPDGMKLLVELIKMPNCDLFVGNHELLMMDAIRNEDECIRNDRKDTDDIDLWLDPCNGGSPTFRSYRDLTVAEKSGIMYHLKNAYVCKIVRVGKKTYHLSHSFVHTKKFKDCLRYSDLSHNEVWDIVWNSIYEKEFLEGDTDYTFPWKTYTYVGGHIFTQRLDCMDEDGKGIIYYNNSYNGHRVFNVDCGMALANKSSQLGCLRLEDEERFYVPLID